MNPTASPPVFTRDTGGIMNRLRRIESWMDARGRKAWIAATILGLVFAWPVGLALLAYITVTSRWSRTMPAYSTSLTRATRSWTAPGSGRSSGNAAFDAYKSDTLKRLEDEQDAFEAFLQRLRDAKDKSEFDAFMDDRAKGARVAAEDSPRGEY